MFVTNLFGKVESSLNAGFEGCVPFSVDTLPNFDVVILKL